MILGDTYVILLSRYRISANSFRPWIVLALLFTVTKGHSTQGQIQKRIVSAETICGNMVWDFDCISGKKDLEKNTVPKY